MYGLIIVLGMGFVLGYEEVIDEVLKYVFVVCERFDG